MKKHALGMVVCNRPDLTFQSLQSLLKCDQPRHEYDLFLIDNGSSTENVNKLKDFIRSSSLPIKTAIFMPEASISVAWNLFLALSRNYKYRTKMDNDMVLRGTISVVVPKPAVTRSPADADPKAGAPMSGPPILGMGSVHAARRKRKQILQERSRNRDTSFLGHLEKFATEYNADLVALVPVSPEHSFQNMWVEVTNARWKGLPYLFGACMLISKKCFDTIGYFDERLPRRIDIDYSQRSINAMMNIGYHDWYYAIHVGARQSTEPHKQLDQKYAYARQIESQQGPVTGIATSQWQEIIGDLEKLAAKNKILNLS